MLAHFGDARRFAVLGRGRTCRFVQLGMFGFVGTDRGAGCCGFNVLNMTRFDFGFVGGGIRLRFLSQGLWRFENGRGFRRAVRGRVGVRFVIHRRTKRLVARGGRRRKFLVGDRIARRGFGKLAAHHRVAARGRMRAVATMSPRTAIDLVIGGALRALLLVDQGLPVGDRNLVVVGMDFAERKKTMTIAAVINEGGLQRRLNARHFRQIDIAS